MLQRPLSVSLSVPSLIMVVPNENGGITHIKLHMNTLLCRNPLLLKIVMLCILTHQD